MDDQGSKVVFTFLSHYNAVKAKRALNNARLIPVPRSISSSCGTALEADYDEVKDNHDFKYEEAYILKEGLWSALHL